VTATDVRTACAALLVDHNRVVLTYVPAPGTAADGAEGADDGEDDDGEDDGRGVASDDGMTEAQA
jgi:hypothetical protein